ncbi:18987_t:CDS:10, partial [Funneliformis geosporum]
GLPGDTGIDIMGSYCGFAVLVKCKDWNSRILVGEIVRFEGALARYLPETTVGMFCISERGYFSNAAIQHAQGSRYNLLLTSSNQILEDIKRFRLGPQGLICKEVLKEILKIREIEEQGRMEVLLNQEEILRTNDHLEREIKDINRRILGFERNLRESREVDRVRDKERKQRDSRCFWASVLAFISIMTYVLYINKYITYHANGLDLLKLELERITKERNMLEAEIMKLKHIIEENAKREAEDINLTSQCSTIVSEDLIVEDSNDNDGSSNSKFVNDNIDNDITINNIVLNNNKSSGDKGFMIELELNKGSNMRCYSYGEDVPDLPSNLVVVNENTSQGNKNKDLSSDEALELVIIGRLLAILINFAFDRNNFNSVDGHQNEYYSGSSLFVGDNDGDVIEMIYDDIAPCRIKVISQDLNSDLDNKEQDNKERHHNHNTRKMFKPSSFSGDIPSQTVWEQHLKNKGRYQFVLLETPWANCLRAALQQKRPPPIVRSQKHENDEEVDEFYAEASPHTKNVHLDRSAV